MSFITQSTSLTAMMKMKIVITIIIVMTIMLSTVVKMINEEDDNMKISQWQESLQCLDVDCGWRYVLACPALYNE